MKEETKKKQEELLSKIEAREKPKAEEQTKPEEKKINKKESILHNDIQKIINIFGMPLTFLIKVDEEGEPKIIAVGKDRRALQFMDQVTQPTPAPMYIG